MKELVRMTGRSRTILHVAISFRTFGASPEGENIVQATRLDRDTREAEAKARWPPASSLFSEFNLAQIRIAP